MERINTYCKEHNISLCAYYTDEAQTGTNMDRQGFQRMIEAARRKEFDAVVIYDVTRGSRDVGDWFAFRKEMMRLGVQVISATQQLGNMEDPNAFLSELLSVGLGQHAVLDTRQKSIAGVAIKAKEGQFLGGTAPLGYDIIDKRYVVNPVEAHIVRTIFTMYAEGRSYIDILEAVKGAKGKKGKALGKNSLNSILSNERYIGVYSWNKRKTKLFRQWAGGALNPDCVRLEGQIDPIIDLDTWKEVQRHMSDNKRRAANKAKREYLLSGLIECEKCGAKFVGHTTRNKDGIEHARYVCGNRYRTRTCDAKSISANEIEPFVVYHMDDYFKTADFDAVSQEIVRRYNEASPQLVEEKRELGNITKQINNAVKAVLAGLELPELEEEIDRLRLRKGELEEIIKNTSAGHIPLDAASVKKIFDNSVEN